MASALTPRSAASCQPRSPGQIGSRGGQHALRGVRPARLCVGALVLTLSAAAEASANGLVLIDADPEWRDAVAVALEPWGTDVGVLDDSEPTYDASPSARGMRLSERSGAAVIVWFESVGDGSVLWVYDAISRSAVGHELMAIPPFDAPTSAAVALSLKTILRHSAVRPEAPSPAPRLSASASDTSLATAAPAPEARAAPQWTLELASGLRFFATEPDDAELRVSLSCSYWPEALEHHLGVGLRVTSGPGIELRLPSIAGRWNETNAEVVLAVRIAPVELLELGARLGVGIGVTSFSGELRPAQAEVQDWRANPGLSVQLALGVRPERSVRFELRVGADLAFRTQRYLVRGEAVLELRGIALSALLGVEVGLDE